MSVYDFIYITLGHTVPGIYTEVDMDNKSHLIKGWNYKAIYH